MIRNSNALLLILLLASTATADSLQAESAVQSELSFPRPEWETVRPQDVGWDPQKLTAAVNWALSQNSSGVVVVCRGRIMAEAYRDVDGSARYKRMVHGRDKAGRTIEDVASVQKSIVSFLAGVAAEKKLLKLSDPVHTHLGTGWSAANKSQEAAITVRHLMTMSSGLNDQLKFVARPGARWRYNTSAYAKTRQVIAEAAGKSPNEFTAAWLTQRIGMKDSRWVERRRLTATVAGNELGFATTARDLARFGLLILARGRWDDDVLLANQRYFREALAPSQKMNPSYGYLWWLNGQSSVRRQSGPLIPEAPSDLVAGLGANVTSSRHSVWSSRVWGTLRRKRAHEDSTAHSGSG